MMMIMIHDGTLTFSEAPREKLSFANQNKDGAPNKN
jgi:hypothetical protein